MTWVLLWKLGRFPKFQLLFSFSLLSGWNLKQTSKRCWLLLLIRQKIKPDFFKFIQISGHHRQCRHQERLRPPSNLFKWNLKKIILVELFFYSPISFSAVLLSQNFISFYSKTLALKFLKLITAVVLRITYLD